MKEIEQLLGIRVKNSNSAFSNGLKVRSESNDFCGYSLKRTNLKSSVLQKDRFFQCAFTGSRFDKTLFKQCDIKYTNFQFSTFDECRFEKIKNEKMLGDNFDHCYFYKTRFNHVKFNGCSMSCAHFVECEFLNCTFYATTMENTSFDNCTFTDVDMTELNIEFSQFMCCKLIKVSFPYTQLPYIIGFSEFNKNEDIHIIADNKSFDFNEYQNQFSTLIDYYKSVKEHFPIANVLLFQKNYEDAYDILRDELRKCLLLSDYRMVKHICRLSTINDQIESNKIKALFVEVKKHLETIQDTSQTKECLMHLDEIRRLTMDAKYNKNSLKIIVETDIASDDLSGINALVNEIETVITNTLPNCYSKSIELRHNSPYEIFIQLCQDLDEIQKMVTAFIDVMPKIETCLSIVCSSIILKDRINKIKNNKKRKKYIQEIARITKITIIID